MKRLTVFLGLLAAMLFLAACAPSESSTVVNETGSEEGTILVYASPL